MLKIKLKTFILPAGSGITMDAFIFSSNLIRRSKPASFGRGSKIPANHLEKRKSKNLKI